MNPRLQAAHIVTPVVHKHRHPPRLCWNPGSSYRSDATIVHAVLCIVISESGQSAWTSCTDKDVDSENAQRYLAEILRVCSWYPRRMLDVSYLMLAECSMYSCMSQCMSQHVCTPPSVTYIGGFCQTFGRDTALPETMTLFLTQVRMNFNIAHQSFLKPFAGGLRYTGRMALLQHELHAV